MRLRFLLLVLLVYCLGVTVVRAELSCEVGSAAKQALTLNINTASAEELSTKLKGIGKAKAAAIIEWRETNGKFQSLEDIDEVKGIGPAILEKNKALIRFED